MKEDKRRFLVSLRPSDVRLSSRSNVSGLEEEGGEEVSKRLGERLEQYLTEREAVMDNPASQDTKLTPGTVIRGEVTLFLCAEDPSFEDESFSPSQVCSVEEEDVGVELGGGVIGKATTHTAQGICICIQ